MITFSLKTNEFFKHPVHPYGLEEDLIVRFELNSFEKVIYVVEILQQHTSFPTFLRKKMKYSKIKKTRH